MLIAKIKTMNFKTTKDNGKVTVLINGNIDTTTSNETLEYVKGVLVDASDLTLDLAGVDYISSAGLRVLLIAQKAMTSKNGKLVVAHVNEDIKYTLELTGLLDILTII